MAKPPAKKKPVAKSAPPKKRTDKRGTPKGKGTVKRPNGSRIGNPKFKATFEQRIKVEVLAANGFTWPMIAEEIEQSETTLKRHFRTELDHGYDRLKARVGATVAQQALAGCRKSQRLFLDRRGGDEWKPKQAFEHSGPEGGAIAVSINGVDAKL